MTNIGVFTKIEEMVTLLAFSIVSYLGLWWARNHDVKIIDFPAVQAFPEGVNRAIEMGRPIVYQASMVGSAWVGAEGIAGLTYFAEIAKQAADKKVQVITLTSSPDTNAYVTAILQEAYGPEFREGFIHFAGGGYQCKAMSVGVIRREMPAFLINIPASTVGPETLEAGLSVASLNIGGAGTMGAYVYGYMPVFIIGFDYMLIGEEVLAGAAAVGRDPLQTGIVIGADYAKIGIITIAAIGFLLAVAGIQLPW
jgi:hypothetical protein